MSKALTIRLADEAATIRLGEDLALALKPGDCLALSGDLGAGKSTLARAFLRAMADDYGALVLLDHLGTGADGEVVAIHLLERRFAEGRRFHLAAGA